MGRAPDLPSPAYWLGLAEDLKRLAERVKLGTIDVKSVDRVVFVLTQCGDIPLSDTSRVVLWQTFGVPVYELLSVREAFCWRPNAKLRKAGTPSRMQTSR